MSRDSAVVRAGVAVPLAILLLGTLAACQQRLAERRPCSDVNTLARQAPDALHQDVVYLKSDDFVVRARAAERLVAAGEMAVPALGEAGEGLVEVHATARVSTTRPVLGSIMAGLPSARLERHLCAPWPVVRRVAAEELGRRDGWSCVRGLIDRMSDPDPMVRAASASSLRRLTNRFFGFDARANLRAREGATRRWEEWWTVEGRVRAAEEGPAGSG